jgi:hypothetical protein
MDMDIGWIGKGKGKGWTTWNTGNGYRKGKGRGRYYKGKGKEKYNNFNFGKGFGFGKNHEGKGYFKGKGKGKKGFNGYYKGYKGKGEGYTGKGKRTYYNGKGKGKYKGNYNGPQPMEIGAIESGDALEWTNESEAHEEEWWPQEEDYQGDGEVNWIDESYEWYEDYYAVNALDDETWWNDEPWNLDSGEDPPWWAGEGDTSWQPDIEVAVPPIVSTVTAGTTPPFRQQAANTATSNFAVSQQVGAVTTSLPAQRAGTLPSRANRPTSTTSVSWIQTVICGVHDDPGLRLILDSGATFHVCPLDFGSQFYLDDREETMDERPFLNTANGSPLQLYGTRSVSLKLRNGATLNISFVVCDTQYPIVSVNRLQEGGFTTCLGKENYIEKDGLREDIYHQQNLFWIKPVGYGDIHLVANIYAFGKQLRDEGGHDAWRLDYNILVRVHNRFRKQLFNPQNTKTLEEFTWELYDQYE